MSEFRNGLRGTLACACYTLRYDTISWLAAASQQISLKSAVSYRIVYRIMFDDSQFCTKINDIKLLLSIAKGMDRCLTLYMYLYDSKSSAVAVFRLFCRCFAIDRSGFVLAHKDFLTSPPSEVHITKMEPEIAADMVERSIMTDDSCVNYADITSQRFYMVSELARYANTLLH